MYIVVEGLDLAGKSALCKKLAKHYKAESVEEPFKGTKVARTAYDGFIKNERGGFLSIHLMMITRVEFFKELGDKTAKGNKEFLISDRNFMSTMVYQSKNHEEMEEILELNKEVIDNYGHDIFPDIIILLDQPHPVLTARLDKRSENDRLDNKIYSKEYYHEMMARYHNAAKIISKVSARTTVIDADHRMTLADLITSIDNIVAQSDNNQ